MGSGDDGVETKVGRLLEEYDLGEEYGAELERAWTGADGERTSLRDLADEFNHDLLAAAMDAAGMSPVAGEVENLHRLLTTEEETAGTRTEVRRRLSQNGIDVEDLESDFVTHQAIRSYLQRERGAEYRKPDAADRVERTAESVGRLRSRLATITESNLEQLRDGDELTLGEFRLFTSVDVLCEDCGSQYPATELLERGGCDCEASHTD